MILYLIRHLPTSWNEQGILQGTNDIAIKPISPAFQKAIEHNKTLLADIPFTSILVSEYQRTQQTANAYGYTDTDFQIDPSINELNFGKYEGQAKKIMVAELGATWMEKPRSLTLGEPIIDFEQRLFHFLEKYNEQEYVLAFAHGRVMRAIKSIYKNGDVEIMNHFEIENNELAIFDFGGFDFLSGVGSNESEKTDLK